jgi:hypothetical protein
VTGRAPGTTYYFSVRAEDEASPDATPGGLSNSPFAKASFVGPFGSGVYDDTATTKWMYVGTWTSTATTAAYGGSYRTSAVVGNSAIFVFEGTQFKFTYTITTSGGVLNVLVDGALVTTINEKGSTTKYKQLYTSPTYTLGQHTVQFVHASGTKTYVDAIEIVGPPDTSNPLAITNLAAVQSATYGAVDLSWTAVAEDATGSMAATSYQVRYSTSNIVDETTWAAASSFTNTLAPKAPGQTENLTVSGLNPGTYYYLSVRAVDEAGNVGPLGASAYAQAKPVEPITTGTYQNTDPRWIFSGFTLVSNTSFDGGSFHRSATIGSTATILVNSTGLQLEFATGPAYGKLEFWVDGTLVYTLNQYAASTAAKYKVKSTFISLGAGVHTIMFKHVSGTYTNIDAIIVP